MKSLLAMVAIGIMCVGCALIPSPAKELLDQADTKLAAEDYGGALALYTDVVDGYPNDPQAERGTVSPLRTRAVPLWKPSLQLSATTSGLRTCPPSQFSSSVQNP